MAGATQDACMVLGRGLACSDLLRVGVVQPRSRRPGAAGGQDRAQGAECKSRSKGA